MLALICCRALLNFSEKVSGECDVPSILADMQTDEGLHDVVGKYIFEHYPEVHRWAYLTTTTDSLHGGWSFKWEVNRRCERYMLKRIRRPDAVVRCHRPGVKSAVRRRKWGKQ